MLVYNNLLAKRNVDLTLWGDLDEGSSTRLTSDASNGDELPCAMSSMGSRFFPFTSPVSREAWCVPVCRSDIGTGSPLPSITSPKLVVRFPIFLNSFAADNALAAPDKVVPALPRRWCRPGFFPPGVLLPVLLKMRSRRWATGVLPVIRSGF